MSLLEVLQKDLLVLLVTEHVEDVTQSRLTCRRFRELCDKHRPTMAQIAKFAVQVLRGETESFLERLVELPGPLSESQNATFAFLCKMQLVDGPNFSRATDQQLAFAARALTTAKRVRLWNECDFSGFTRLSPLESVTKKRVASCWDKNPPEMVSSKSCRKGKFSLLESGMIDVSVEDCDFIRDAWSEAPWSFGSLVHLFTIRTSSLDLGLDHCMFGVSAEGPLEMLYLQVYE